MENCRSAGSLVKLWGKCPSSPF